MSRKISNRIVTGFSCSEDASTCASITCILCGTYVSQADSSHSIEFRSDGTAYLHEGGTQTSGTWQYNGVKYLLDWQGYPGPTSVEIKGNAVIDNVGIVWVKK